MPFPCLEENVCRSDVWRVLFLYSLFGIVSSFKSFKQNLGATHMLDNNCGLIVVFDPMLLSIFSKFSGLYSLVLEDAWQ